MTPMTIFVAATALAAADAASQTPSASDLKRMQGDWMVTTMKVDGISLPPDDAQALFRSIRGNTYSVSRYTKVIAHGTFKLDPEKSPKTIDSLPTTSAKDAKPLLGIYEFANGKLRICNAPPGKDRPADFTARRGSGQTLIVWEPEKK